MVDRKENKNDNVIHFPKNKVEPSNVVTLPLERKVSEPSAGKGKMLYGSLAMVFLTAIVINSKGNWSTSPSTTQSRSLASVSADISGLQRDEKLERAYVDKLSKKRDRRPASLGQAPSAADEFKFGYLESKYAVKFYQGKVQEVEFASLPNQNIEPRYVSNRPKFIAKYKNLFPVPFSSTVSVNREVANERIHETYSLLNDSQTKVGQIFFELDVYGRLLAMKVQSIQ